jgi:hypothetical protein
VFCVWGVEYFVGVIFSVSSITTLGMVVRRFQDVLPLHVFVHRQKVLRLLRTMLRCTRRIDNLPLRYDMVQQINREFAKNKHVPDPMLRRNLITEGNRQLEDLEALVRKSEPNSEEVGAKEVGKGWPWEK